MLIKTFLSTVVQEIRLALILAPYIQRRKFAMQVKEQLKNITPILIIVFAAATAVLSIVIMMATKNNVQLNHFTKDPTQLMNEPFYLGLFSNIGILLWCGSAVICFFSKAVLPETSELKPLRRFLFYSALVTLMLMLDDLFLLHEEVFPDYLGIPEFGVYVIYCNVLLLYVLFFWQIMLKTDFIILGLAFFLIGLSTIVKQIPMPIPEDTFLEDAVKLFGIICWFMYFLRLGYKSVMRVI